ncbi:MAG TPA: hypothetical protein PLA27_01840, partial [Anaerolineales bacterium]|nr:hypothetical protein [Anaerolineales bacterium]
TEHTEKDNFLKLFSVKISGIRGIRVEKKKLRNSFKGLQYLLFGLIVNLQNLAVHRSLRGERHV